MIVNVEFFSEEQIENLVTCINYVVDKVICFGDPETMTEEAKALYCRLLDDICGVKDVEFVDIDPVNYKSTLYTMDEVVSRELENGSRCFFDLTGGDEVCLVAMGALSTRLKLPMHCFRIETNELLELNMKDVPGIDDILERQVVSLNLDDIIAMKGGSVNYREQKLSKSHLDDPEFRRFVKALWSFNEENPRKWNAVSGIMKSIEANNELNGVIKNNKIISSVYASSDISEVREFLDYMNRLKEKGLIKDAVRRSDGVFVEFHDKATKELLMDSGSVLELHTYYKLKDSGKYDDVRVGIHLDWDNIHRSPGIDVENEIDVLALEGLVPTFISCKNGKVNQMALYEIQTVAERFGGKYAKRELMASVQVAEAYVNRAKEMNIKLRRP